LNIVEVLESFDTTGDKHKEGGQKQTAALSSGQPEERKCQDVATLTRDAVSAKISRNRRVETAASLQRSLAVCDAQPPSLTMSLRGSLPEIRSEGSFTRAAINAFPAGLRPSTSVFIALPKEFWQKSSKD